METKLNTTDIACWNEVLAERALTGCLPQESPASELELAYAAWESHLAECVSCRQALEERAGSRGDWNLAKDLLSNERGLETFPTAPQRAEQKREQWLAFVQQQVRPIPSDDPNSLGRLGSYELVGIVGRGGMGIVFKAFDRSLNRYVAIKILDPLIADREVARIRFARESRAMAAISHEHVVPIYSVDEHRSLPYFVMEYVPGGTLEHRLATEGPMPAIPWLRVAIQIAQGLEAAHRQGLIHRDIKPSNILLDNGVERVRVTDFGLARELDQHGETCSGTLLGTPTYMSPEQVLGRPCDARSDLFSLGSLLYQLAVGYPPFAGESIYGTLKKIASEPPMNIAENRQLPEWMLAMINKLLAKEPEHRFATASELVDALTDELVYLQDPQGPVPSRPWLSENPERRGQKITLARIAPKVKPLALAAIGGLAISGLGWWLSPSGKMTPKGGEFPINQGVHSQNDPGQKDPGQKDPNQEPAVPPEVAEWRDRIAAIKDHKVMAFKVGAELMKLDPQVAKQAAMAAWPKITTREAKTGLLKSFQFGEHPEVLAILHLGMMDADPEVKTYAEHYLKRHSFTNIDSKRIGAYEQWYKANGHLPLDEVHEKGLRSWLEPLKKAGCKQGLQTLAMYDLTWDQSNDTERKLAMIASRIGYGELALEWLHEKNLEPRERLAVLRMLTALKTPIGPRDERLLASWESDDSQTYAKAIFDYRTSVDAEGTTQRLENRVKELLAEPTFDMAKNVAAMMLEVGDDRAIPLQIAIIDADNSYDTIYMVGYFGLSRGKLAEKIGVAYSKWRDGAWWRRWWERNRQRFSPTAQAFPILDLPKTPRGESYQPLPFDIDTSQGRYALGRYLLDRQEEGWMELANLIAESKDPRDIPLLIGLLDADNSNEAIYRIAYFGLVPLINGIGKHQLEYVPYRDGAWWKRWWAEHAADFGEDCRALTIPEFKKTPHGHAHQPFPEDLDSMEGHRWIIQHELSKPNPELVVLSSFFSKHGDERDIPWLIAVAIASEETTGASYLKNNAIATLARLEASDLSKKDADWWRNWWRENHVAYPTAEPNLPDLSEWMEKKPSLESPTLTWSSQGATANYYRIGGDASSKVPPQGFKLLVVLPGGDGGRDFHPFVQNIYRESLDPSWIVVQPIAMQWTTGQQVVWPTDILPVEGMKFSTEEMVEGIVADMKKNYAIDSNHVISMAWSSSGPAAYAMSLRPGSPIRGSYIAMSVYKPQFLVNLELAKGHRFVIEHSPEDKLCPYRMAEAARKTLREAGAEVTDVDYPGGHGWHGDIYARIRAAMQHLAP